MLLKLLLFKGLLSAYIVAGFKYCNISEGGRVITTKEQRNSSFIFNQNFPLMQEVTIIKEKYTSVTQIIHKTI